MTAVLRVPAGEDTPDAGVDAGADCHGAIDGQDPIDELLDDLVADGRIVHVEHLPPRAPRAGVPAVPLRPEVAARLPHLRLWSHQAAAIDRARAGRSVVVATGTASGKSLCYQLPIADAIADPVLPASALALFPTKALAHDQLRAITALDFPGLVAATYDGDSTREERSWTREHANVVFTNPEMVHGGLLPNHRRWATFLHRLRYVVIDELHVLRGVFGTHVAHLLRRLRRICAHYGSVPTFVFCSATIGDPARLASELCGLPVDAVTSDGSPLGGRRFALLNPPVVDERSGVRTSANAETASIMARLVGSGARTIAFCASRKGTELVARDVRRQLRSPRSDAVRSYRSGYLPGERREIEAELASGAIDGVVATSALELGIDIGGLDACVLNGFPGTIASMWQQAGRAGRGCDDSLAVLVAGDDQLDQWLMSHPGEVFARSPEPAVVNPRNPFVADPHLACAAHELPLTHADAQYWGDDELHDGVRRLVLDDMLAVRERRGEVVAVWTGRGWPSRGVGLRSGSSVEYRIALDDGRLVGTIDEARAFSQVHPGAVYLHRGETYRVAELDLPARTAVVEPADGTEYTQTRSDTAISVLATEQRRDVGRAALALGSAEVVTQVTGYQRKDVRTRRVLGNHRLDLPPQQLVTRAFWYTFPPELLADAGVDPDAVPGTLHALEHAVIAMLPLFTICDRWDVGGVSTALQADTGLPSVFVYDGYPGGAGIAELGFSAADRHLVATLELLEACGCTVGCPSCVQSPKCGNGNEPLDKHGAIALLRAVLGDRKGPATR